MSKQFQGKTVLITGASVGFGAAFARSFAKEGARLILVARRKDRLEQLKRELGVEMLVIALDVSDHEAVVKHLGHLPKPFDTPDILINNAGLGVGMDKLWEVTPEKWNRMIDVNVKGLLSVSSQIVPKMIKVNAGHIINIGSTAGHEAYPGGGVYCATKHAVRAITDALRKELVATPIRVSMISPGMVGNTEFSVVRFEGDHSKAGAVYEDIEALSAEDIADLVLFVASRPAHVNIADVVIYPTNQASPTLVHRSKSF